MIKSRWLHTSMVVLLLALMGCAQASLPTPVPTPVPTHTPSPPPTPPAPAYDPEPATITVCAEGCTFSRIQAAIDSTETSHGDLITVMDAVHVEAGITVHKDITVQGLGADRSIVQAHSSADGAPDRVFLVPEGTTVRIRGMTIRHGHPNSYPRAGGGIANFGHLTVERCVVRDNSANDGGGIFNQGTLTVVYSSISNNLSDKEAPPGYECGSGGGVKNGFRGTLILENCSVHGNRALGKGGGIFVACEGTATITNSTISNNLAVRNGGGVYVKGDGKLVHCTIAQNKSSESGGGIYVRGTMDWSNCLVAGNVKQDVTIGGEGGYKGKGVINTNLFNWVADGSCPSDHSGDVSLGPLADNGGGTLTHSLLPGSPAIDVVPATACSLPSDQRGEPRPIHISSAAPACDVGAFEWWP